VALRKGHGVKSADVSYELGRAVVTFDSTATNPDRFIAELERMTGFQATVQESR
jgi:copper chaperone CopZ